ncbi:hypothetical protein V4C56_32225 [Paraburkholderia azotifigens]|uniref:Uncharacterized protein n=1 Tax=Paraburkholderia azotifigens TaxID=2057004 RepID=A0ABU9RC03_9BURK|nr:hypothetical protein [Paraburkholderia azotifigens]
MASVHPATRPIRCVRLEPVVGGNVAAKLKGVKGDPVAQQPELEMELVGFATAVDHADGIKPDILEIGEAG